MAPRIYLDHAATTPMRPQAIAAMAEGVAIWANPSSPHAEGRAARRALEDARERIRAALGWPGEVILTSGASEALALAMRGKERVAVSAVEHDAVFRAAPGAQVLPVVDGRVDTDQLEGTARAIVAIQHVNSETGTVLIAGGDPALARIRNAGGFSLVDCSQSATKLPLPDADLVVVSAHKLGGPPGVGALLVRGFGLLEPVGGQEFGYRGGTENLPGALGFAAAAEAAWDWRTTGLQRLQFGEALSGVSEVLEPGVQSSHIFAVAMPSLTAAAQLIRFDALGFAVSAGSACSSGTLKRSRALAGFGIAENVAARTIRVSLGWSTTPEDLDRFLDAYCKIAADAGSRAA